MPHQLLPILKNEIAPSRVHAHERFSEAPALERRLRQIVRGDVRFDDATRALFATDASNYRQVPLGVVMPLDQEDVIATVAACRELGAPLLSRGAGTSLAGQGCNAALILDFTPHMSLIRELSPQKRLAWVQPGVVLDTLRGEAEKYALTFAPDPATHDRCTLGGMIGNNSCGAHALMGGTTVDNIVELEILLYDGTRMRVGRTSEEELSSIIAQAGRKGQIYAGLRNLRDQYARLIRERFPRLPRRVSGYNLDQLLPENGFHVARALVGSEGTCVTVLEAVCELKPSPQHRRLAVLAFSDAFVAADHVPRILNHHPIAVEGFDGLLVDFMRRKHLALDDLHLLPSGRGFLLCEFGADTESGADAAAKKFVQAARSFPSAPQIALYTQEEATRVWKVRESALGASVFVPGEETGWEGWEDSAVPPEQLGNYLRELFTLIDAYGYKTPMYGHFGQGCVHLRITFDFKTAEGIAKYRRFINEAAGIVLKYGGSLSGEHGDGQARASLLPRMFGPELVQAFAEFKALWDPFNKMNPGKLIDPVAVYDPTENLRQGDGHRPATPETWFRYTRDNGSFGEAVSRCVGIGACRKQNHGTMCPSYMATGEEQHSTRGRAHLLWELMHGNILTGGWRNSAVKAALDLCLSCKACKTECPAQVDVATWKAEYLAHHYQNRLHPLNHYVFGYMDRFARLAACSPRLANLGMRLPGVETLAKSILGVAPQRKLPRVALKDFRTGFRARTSASRNPGKVLLWCDTWNNYFYPEALIAAATVLQTAGYQVEVPRGHICCGRPLYDFGFLDQARAYLSNVLTRFGGYIDAGIPFVMLEPSCASVFADELLNFFPHDERAIRLSRQTMMLGSFLSHSQTTWHSPEMQGKRIVMHGHCHQKSLMTMEDDVRLLLSTGATVELLDSGCCGMAGPFGFERANIAVSQTLAERVLLPAVRSMKAEDIFVTNGFSCREQIRQNSTVRAVHLAEVLVGCAHSERTTVRCSRPTELAHEGS